MDVLSERALGTFGTKPSDVVGTDDSSDVFERTLGTCWVAKQPGQYAFPSQSAREETYRDDRTLCGTVDTLVSAYLLLREGTCTVTR